MGSGRPVNGREGKSSTSCLSLDLHRVDDRVPYNPRLDPVTGDLLGWGPTDRDRTQERDIIFRTVGLGR